ncbi:major facilitator superfamily domain-containing protein 4A-like [Varroa destructor]|uniref:Major facilitator superfamily domain-containing protein 4A n=1 Tax=Varroa destructor TaxID=109461 RepID=A0A7M7JDD5_VARDE|nr:major facilitator superfamily domain-containing protein 4A-like [Varroa destructor]XP_022650200.1 major facilitator superfamily domain-containing protein 4A-like [Varroa destructor]
MHPKQTFVTSEEWDGPSWLKWFQIANINLTCVALGLIVSMMGPSLIDLSEIFHTSIQKASNIGVVADVGALIGPVFADLIYRRVNAQIVCIICGALIGLGNILMPLGSLMSAYAISFTCGMLGAIMEIGAYVWLVALCRGSRPMLQLYSLMFGVGALFAPLLAKPFLSKDRDLMANRTDADIEWKSDSRVMIPFVFVGSFGIMVAFFMTLSYLRDKRDLRPEEKCGEERSHFRNWLLISLAAIYFFLIVLLETAFSRFLVIFAVQMNHMLKADAAVLVSLFWVGFTAVRVIIIPISAKFRSIWFVASGQLIFSAACLILLLFSQDNRMLYLGTIMFGCGMGPLYGGSLTWLTEHIELRHVYLSLILIMTCGGAMVAPPIVSPRIETHPSVLTTTIAVGSTGMLFVLLAMVVAARLTEHASIAAPRNERNRSVVSQPNAENLSQLRIGVDNMAMQTDNEILDSYSKI